MVNLQSGSSYKLTNEKAGNVLDLSGGDNKSIIGYEWHGSDNQKWRVQQDGNNWTIQNVGTGKWLAVEGDAGDGAAVVGRDEPYQWEIKEDQKDSSVLRIYAPGTKYNVDLADHGNATAGNKIHLWAKWTEGRNQCWRFENGMNSAPGLTPEHLAYCPDGNVRI
ncbi:hypothetical protein HGRIS_011024 [Hohenbuehelia grisea]|uniref:Ricin B lectin domain-containing protein n=1 Tax=Hohenbuehelia grisea TaxID=104357 RepID=A0ABR3IYK3_9AGAR